MLANFFSKSKPINFIVLFLLFLVYVGVTLFVSPISFFSAGKKVLLFMVIFSIYNFIVLKNNVTFDHSFAFLFYVILLGFFLKNIQVNSIFYANITCLLFLRKVFSLQSPKKKNYKLFDAGLWLGISFIIEPYTLIFIWLLYITLHLHDQLTYQTLLVPFIGFFTPVFLYFTYCFWYDSTYQFWQLFSWEITLDYHLFLSPYYIFSSLLISTFTLISILFKSPKVLVILDQFRKNWILMIWHFFLSGIVFFLVLEKSGTAFLYLLFPISIILANGLELIQKKWLANSYILLFLISSFVVIVYL